MILTKIDFDKVGSEDIRGYSIAKYKEFYYLPDILDNPSTENLELLRSIVEKFGDTYSNPPGGDIWVTLDTLNDVLDAELEFVN